MSEKKQHDSAVPQFILKHVEANPKEIVSFTADQFGISRQAVLKHVRSLVEEEKLAFTGTTRNRIYALKSKTWEKRYSLDGNLKEDKVLSQDILPRLGVLPENVLRILSNGFSEMLNNAIDHSEGSSVVVRITQNAVWQEITIYDNGIGIFKKIKHAFDLVDENHAVLELLKGKLTTDPKRHSGEGIFFTSRSVDRFAILSYGVNLLHHGNQIEDYVFGKDYISTDHGGTAVFLHLNNDSTRTMQEIYDTHATENDGGFGFNKTVIPIRLAFQGNEMLVSRSQAKRLLNRFERFDVVMLDFEGVREIGQAFADEIFRVFPNFHPATEIRAVNANDQIQKMISRAKNADV
jgi:anti-sigma regulatory factor (Ser/Thr protein kinase)